VNLSEGKRRNLENEGGDEKKKDLLSRNPLVDTGYENLLRL